LFLGVVPVQRCLRCRLRLAGGQAASHHVRNCTRL
jgi:hypothetical protein